MKTYQYYQPNQKDIKDTYGDCVIRAFTKVTGKEWTQVFDELVPLARDFQAMPNSKVTYQQYLKNNGFVYTGVSNKAGTTRPSVESFSKSHKSGRFVLVTANHLVACVDGHYYDTWDSGWKRLYGYWTKND